MADDARPSTALERPALASVLATVTDRPVGHWIAELKSPAFRGGWEILGRESAALWGALRKALPAGSIVIGARVVVLGEVA